MNFSIKTTVATRICDAKTGKVIKERKPECNLVMDPGLNGLAKSNVNWTTSAPAFLNAFCMIGSGTTANSTASGAITFTQVTTTITASGAFFTAGMVGALFKYGTGSGGAELYITGFTSSTIVTVGTSLTVATPTVATVWFVARTTLDTFLFASSTYQTNSGDCGSTISGNSVTHKRTILFPQQASPYTVNEIGYAPSNNANKVCGRIVLSSSDNVGTANFYVVVISITMTLLPASPTSVSNVGTNINTAGNLAIECMSVNLVSASGGTTVNVGALLDSNTSPTLYFATATYSQNGSIDPATALTITSITTGSVAWANDNTKVGSMTLTITGALATTGQNLFGVGIGSSSRFVADVKFTATQTAPTGTFQPNTIWRLTYTRVLVN